MSGWRLPTLEVSDGKGLEFYSPKECSLCRRNVFVAVHEGDEDYNTIKERLEEQGLTIRDCEQRDGKTIVHFDKCIFHVEKDNEVWMHNHEEYRQWIENRERGEETREDFEINWNGEFVKEFWRLIRKYRDVPFNKNSVEGSWGILRGEGEFYYYDFRMFVFPQFEERRVEKRGNIYFATDDFSFWRRDEEIQFVNSTNFIGAQFKGEADFWGAQFKGKAYFWEARFNEGAYFWGAQFKGEANFRKTRFLGNTDFNLAEFYKKANFDEALFQNEVSFGGARFNDYVHFEETQFIGKVDFSVHNGAQNAIFKGKAHFINCQFGEVVNFEKTQFEEIVRFSETIFNKEANFEKAIFKNSVIFFNVTFVNGVNFKSVEFKRKLDFLSVRFNG